MQSNLLKGFSKGGVLLVILMGTKVLIIVLSLLYWNAILLNINLKQLTSNTMSCPVIFYVYFRLLEIKYLYAAVIVWSNKPAPSTQHTLKVILPVFYLRCSVLL